MRLRTHYATLSLITLLIISAASVWIVHVMMRQEAIRDAEEISKILLAEKKADLQYFMTRIRPAIFATLAKHGIAEPDFDPTWMSAGYRNRIGFSYFKELGYTKYYYKNAAINARSEANEADPFEVEFLQQVRNDPDTVEKIGIQYIDDEPFLVYMQKYDLTFTEACMRCHSTPDKAPKGMIQIYGAARSFNKDLGDTPSVQSLRIPLKEAFSEINTLTLKLSLFLIGTLLAAFILHLYFVRRNLIKPVVRLRNTVLDICRDESRLGEVIETEGFSELTETAQAFSSLSIQLAASKQTLEQKVEERTKEIEKANRLLLDEIEKRDTLEHQYANLINSMLDAVGVHEMILDPQNKPVDYRFLFVNPAFEKMTSLKAENIINKTVLEVMPQTEQHWIRTYGDVVLTGNPIRFENYSQELNKYFEVVAFCNAPGQFTTIFQDVTGRKIMETQKRQAHKMEAIGTMAGGIAHDFNNILTIILGNSEILKDKLPQGSSSEKYVDHVIKASNRAKNLVKQILSYTRYSDHELLPFKPCAVIKESIKLLRSITPASVSIVQDICQDTGVIMADPTQLHQLFMNLFSNAIHAMNEQGTLTVTENIVQLSKKDFRPQENLQPGDYVKISVSDTGTGMDEKTLERIFDPFFTTKDVDEGTGMGLSTVMGIIQSHKGMVRVESQLGKGSTFHLFLPIVDEETTTVEKEKSHGPLMGSEHILVVDDEEMLANVTGIMLETYGYTVTIKTRAHDALEMFSTHPHTFDLVISDQTMPDMTGADLARELLLIRPDIQIILCTGYSQTISPEEAHKIGIKDYIFKPFDREQLAISVRKVLDEEGQKM